MKVLIETFSAPGCPGCAEKLQSLKSIAQELGRERFEWRDVNVLEETGYAVRLGVLTPPSLAIDGELVFPALPTPNRLRAELARRLNFP